MSPLPWREGQGEGVKSTHHPHPTSPIEGEGLWGFQLIPLTLGITRALFYSNKLYNYDKLLSREKEDNNRSSVIPTKVLNLLIGEVKNPDPEVPALSSSWKGHLSRNSVSDIKAQSCKSDYMQPTVTKVRIMLTPGLLKIGDIATPLKRLCAFILWRLCP